MLGKSILVLSPDRVGARRLGSWLRAAGNDAVYATCAEAAGQLVAAGAVDLLLWDAGDGAGVAAAVEAAGGRVPLVALASEAGPEVVRALVCEHGLRHVIAGGTGTGRASAREVVVTVEKLLRRDLFGIDKYLSGFAVDRCAFEVRAAADRDALVERVGAYARGLGAGRELSAAVGTIVDELVTNAVYNAPRDAGGAARYAAVDRREKIELDPWEHAQLEFGSDGERLVIAVTDWFGALSAETVRACLRRCLTAKDPIERKAGGAGLGLYTVLRSCSQLVFDIEPGARTEVIAVIDIGRRMGGVRAAGASLHVFVSERAAERAPSAPVPETIELSDSLRVDLRSALARVEPAPQGGRPPVTLASRRRHPSAPPAVISAPEEQLGFDTARGLIRGARSVDVVVDVALRLLAGHYAGAVAFDVRDGSLAVQRAVGRVSRPSRLRNLHIGLDDPCSVAGLAREGAVAVFRPAAFAMDYRVAALTSGFPEASGLVIPVEAGGTLRMVLYACAPRAADAMQPCGLERLQRELSEALARLELDEDESTDYCYLEVG